MITPLIPGMSVEADRMASAARSKSGGSTVQSADFTAVSIDAQTARAFNSAPGERVVASSGVQRQLATLMLTQVLTTIMPKGDGAHDTGLAGDVWQSMLAEQLAHALAPQIAAAMPAGEPESLAIGPRTQELK